MTTGAISNLFLGEKEKFSELQAHRKFKLKYSKSHICKRLNEMLKW
jgi:hypothetical protein